MSAAALRLTAGIALVLLAACQTAAPPGQGKTTTIGDTTVTTSGSVGVEAGYVN